jgi:quercetin dioxygenase-like cupin family protein
MGWKMIIRRPGEGEQILFKIGLMTFKASSAETDGQFALLETVLPPGARVEAHSHPEAEWFYILASEFRFRVGDPLEEVVVGPGAFLCVPPHVRHEYEHLGDTAGRLLGMMLPGGAGGLESFFRQVGVPVNGPDEIPDLDRPVGHLQAAIRSRRSGIAEQSAAADRPRE